MALVTRPVWLLLAALTGCGDGGDACDGYASATCVALLVEAPSGQRISVDQVSLTGNLGFVLNDTRTPSKALDPPVLLPVTLPLLPPAGYAGEFGFSVDGLLGGVPVGTGMASGMLTAGKHQRVRVTLEPPMSVDFAGLDLWRPDMARSFDAAALDFATIGNIGPSTDVAENVLTTWTIGESLSDAIQPCNPVQHGSVTLVADTSMVKVGTEAVRLDYGPNSHYYFDAVYPATRNAGWNLSTRTGTQFWTTGALPTSYVAWQPGGPELVLCSATGYRRYTPMNNHEPRNSDPYVFLQIPIGGSAEWVMTDNGTFDITAVNSLEIHLDPQAAGTGMGTVQVWYDGVSFY
jgi:hypothetical protein